MPDSSLDLVQPSAAIQTVLTAVAADPVAAQGMVAVRDREAEFSSPMTAQLTGVALHTEGRRLADRILDAYWSEESRRQELVQSMSTDREVIIGSGFHAAAYAATRVLAGYPKPLVLESAARPGGTFALTDWPGFRLNSPNRPGGAGPAGDQTTNPNDLPGAPIQAAHLSMDDYSTNTDMGFVIRLTLAQFAEVITDTQIVAVSAEGTGIQVDSATDGPLPAGRIIDARGLGEPKDRDLANGTTVVTFPQFLQRMTDPWPLRGVRSVAVIGGGDSGKCTVESLLGIGPHPRLAAAALDTVDRIDWYSTDLPTTCQQWRQEVRGRYQAIGRYLRPDQFGRRRLTVQPREARPIGLPGSALIDGRTYDLAILCTGYREICIDGLFVEDFDPFLTLGVPVARQHFAMPVFRVGPHARLPFTDRERADGLADIPGNAVSMWRTGPLTAALAATLPAVMTDPVS
ncbi:hypothetical protein [Cryptosporangium minutisporangium]|uniref:Uncharacterized protein n=1 Tax=Cryptosporangium minutisporangium TaxID=113569 RepID=A0ABP6SW25_9ACTN